MAQIIKQRRGSITQLKDVTARVSELVVATGSIGNLNGPFLFVGETEGVAGAYRPISKIYQGSAAPTITVGSYGSIMDGTPFYASSDKSLYILSQAGNSILDFTGNIEGNTISNVTITSLTGSNANYTNLTGVTFTSTNSNITSLTGSDANITNLTGSTLTSTNANITSLTGSNGNITNLTGSTLTSTNANITSLTGSNANISNLTGNTFTSANANITSLTGSNAFVTNITGGTLTVTGTTNLNGDLLISGNIIQTGSIDLTGDVKIGGNITVGDSTSDFISFGAEISSSIIPDVHNAFDLGSSDKNWKNLHVSGTAYVNILEAQSISLDGITVFEDLVVSGSSYLGHGAGDEVVVSGSLYNDQLTNNRVVIVGTQGLLEDDANFVFDGTELNIGQGDFTVQQSSGNVDTNGALNVGGATTLESTLVVTGSTELKNNLGVAGTLDVTGSTVLKDTLEGRGAVGLNSTLDVTGSTVLKDTLQVDSTTQLKGAVGINSTLDVTGSAQFKNNVGIAGTLDVTGSTVLKDTLQVDSTSQLKGAVGINSTLDVTGSTVLKSTLEGRGAVGLNSTLDVTGSVVLKSTLQVNSTSELIGAVGINSTLDVTGSAQFKGTINVDGESTLASATVEDLTQDRIVTVGAGGSLIDNTGFTYNGTTLIVGGGKFEVDNSDGDIRTSGSLTSNGLTSNGDLTVNGVLTVTGNTQLQSNLYVSGNLEVLGSATNVSLQSSTVEIGDNIILVNAYSPFQQYAGLAAYDSGSAGSSGSFLWDSLNDYWMLVSSSGESSKIIGTTAGTYGTENSLTDTYFPIATGTNTIGNSLLRYSGTTLSFNTNKFTIDSGTGDTLVSGNFTLSYSGGTDTNSNTSAIMFRNSSNVVGFVTTTETEDVLDGILGYKNSNGGLVFSTVIDGGTY